MYYKIDERLYDEIKKITSIEYDYDDAGYISEKELENMLKDLVCIIDKYDEMLTDVVFVNSRKERNKSEKKQK